MNKIVIIITGLVLLTVLIYGTNAAEIKGYSSSIGVTLDNDLYGDVKYNNNKTKDIYYVRDGVSYKVGWVKVDGGVYQNQNSAKYNLIISKVSIQPSAKSSIKVGWFRFNYKPGSKKMNFESVVNSGYLSFGYGAYWSSVGNVLKEHTPTIQPTTNSMNLSLGNSGASMSYPIDVSDLNLVFGHVEDTTYAVEYDLYCTTLSYYQNDCEYYYGLTHQNQMYIVEAASSYGGTSGTFLNILRSTFTVEDSNGFFSTSSETLRLDLFY